MIYKGKSTIHGTGLFAGEPIKKGEVIGRWEVQHLNSCFMKSRPHIHNIWIEDIEYRVTNLLKYANFGNKPNAESYGWLITATKNIKKDEEITWDYGGEFEE